MKEFSGGGGVGGASSREINGMTASRHRAAGTPMYSGCGAGLSGSEHWIDAALTAGAG
jgi:hypothetical protein